MLKNAPTLVIVGVDTEENEQWVGWDRSHAEPLVVRSIAAVEIGRCVSDEIERVGEPARIAVRGNRILEQF